MLRWGIMGNALIARQHLAPAIQSATGSCIQAIASRSQVRADAFADQFNVPLVFDSYEAMLACDDVDAVYIPTVTSEHTSHTLSAIDAGKAVLCEKPMGMTADDIHRIQAAADAKGVLVGEAYMVAHHPQWHKVKDLIAQGAIGDLRVIQGAFTYYNDDPDNMRNVEALGGGGLRDIGVYPSITTLLCTHGTPKSYHSTIERDPSNGTDVLVTADIDFGDFRLNFYVSTRMSPHQRMVFHGTTGHIEVHVPFNAGTKGRGTAQISLWNNGSDQGQIFRFPDVNQYQEQVEAFAQAYHGDTTFPVSLALSLKVQEMIDGIRAASTP